MNNTREIPLDAAALTPRETALEWFRETLRLPAGSAENLDALFDAMTEIKEDVALTADRQTLVLLAASSFSFTLLKIITRAADENPHIHFLCR